MHRYTVILLSVLTLLSCTEPPKQQIAVRKRFSSLGSPVAIDTLQLAEDEHTVKYIKEGKVELQYSLDAKGDSIIDYQISGSPLMYSKMQDVATAIANKSYKVHFFLINQGVTDGESEVYIYPPFKLIVIYSHWGIWSYNGDGSFESQNLEETLLLKAFVHHQELMPPTPQIIFDKG